MSSSTSTEQQLFTIPTHQRAQVCTKFGDDSAQCLQLVHDHPVPIETSIEPNQVLVKVMAASVNPVDYKIVRGVLGRFGPQPPCVLGNDASGIVVQVGTSVTKFKVGDCVLAYKVPTKLGTYCEYTTFHENEVAKKPPLMSWTDAACTPLVSMTIWKCLQYVKDPATELKDQPVLVVGASGGTGSWGVLLLKHFYGAKVYAVCSTNNLEYVRSLGADVVIDYKTQDYSSVISENGDRLKLVIDCVGGYDVIDKSYTVLDKRGTFVTICSPKDLMGFWDICSFAWTLLWKKTLSFATHPNFYIAFANPDGAALQNIVDWAERNGQLYKLVRTHSEYELEDVPKAHTDLETHRTVGKIAIRVQKDSGGLH